MARRVVVGGALTFAAGIGMGLADGVWGVVHAVLVALSVTVFALWVDGATG